jgi:DNA-binding MarR family transcriptional regulator
MPRKSLLERQYPWAKTAPAPNTITPHRVPFPLARRFHQICATVVAETYAGEELRPLDYAALACLDDFPGIDQRRLAHLMGVDRTNAGQIVEQLETRRLLERRINGDDRRARELQLTPAGKKLRRGLQPKLLAAQARMLAPLSTKERETLIDLLVRVIEANEAHARPGAGRRPPKWKKNATVSGANHDQKRNPSVSRRRDSSSSRYSDADRAS